MSEIKIKFQNAGEAGVILDNAYRLKNSSNYSGVYVSPDRSREEQKIHSELVQKLKEKIKNNPELFWSIRDGKLVAKPHKNRSVSCSESEEIPQWHLNFRAGK